ncbi:hypothetical protein [Engelhardtia mirabilis]|uniref:Bacterial Ig-like domain (Group 2) n=1 Tax=Engelhardtia mirabilis TaxID=2528011 RepID=A0A518BID5_9BACT|nr:hypothetical protein Pla133_18130 [Planctomycetes bacterium Pla133]QDV01063.1 hypothetical protein Pla86_18120 [Planctomycetes bacterium Pla86]
MTQVAIGDDEQQQLRAPRAAGLVLLALTALCGAPACGGGGGGGPAATSVGPASPNPLGISIVPPPAATLAPVVVVAGKASAAGSAVTVQGGASEASVVAGTDRSFSVNVPLVADRRNALFLRETTPTGEGLPAVPLEVVQDGTPPRVAIEFPADGATLTSSTTAVSGRVGDLLSGFAGLSVTVDGVPAVVDRGFGSDGSFWLDGVVLDPFAPTQIEVVATDAVGNESTTSATVVFQEPAGFTLAADGGDGQTAVAGQFAAAPLEVGLSRPDGSPLAGKLVRFEVAAGGGRLAPDDGSGVDPSSPQRVQVLTDSIGVARARFELGSRAGRGVHRVRADSVDVEGQAWFLASAVAGSELQVHAVTGELQSQVAGGVAGRMLEARVTDGANPIAGRAVRFQVMGGTGVVRNPATGVQAAAVTANSDATGLARVQYFTGAEPGIERIEARLDGLPEAGLTQFTLRVLAAGQPATSFGGFVIDGGLQPLVGGTCRLQLGELELTAVTDERGRFLFSGIEGDGPATLTIDGDTVSAVLGPAGFVPVSVVAPYPTVTREVFIAPGVAGSLPGPLVLPRLPSSGGQLYNGTSDVTLTLAGLPGFRLTIPAGSLTLPPHTVLGDGSSLGATVTPSPGDPLPVPAILTAVQVAIDDLPAPLPDGAPALLGWYLSPGGASVSAPTTLKLPNLGGLRPGARAAVQFFDEAGGRFERFALATVEPDGRSLVASLEGGLATSGWMALSAGGAAGIAATFDESAAATPKFSPLWSIRLGGRVVPGGAQGGFELRDVPVRDGIGDQGAGGVADGLADRMLRVTGVRESGGGLLFATTAPLTFSAGESLAVTPGSLSSLPPNLPASLAFGLDLTALVSGGVAFPSFVATLSNGAKVSVVSAAAGATYVSTDAHVATVDDGGVVTATGAGSATIGAFNDGLAASVDVAVTNPAPLTVSVVGSVVTAEGAPVPGATVSLGGLGVSVLSAADGSFALADLVVQQGAGLSVTALLEVGSSLLLGSAALPAPVDDGIVDAGLLSLQVADRALVFGEPVDGTFQAELVADALTAAGLFAEYLPTLPTDLDAYAVLWCAETFGSLTLAQEQALVEFVQSGRGLHLSGERDACCSAANAFVQRILDGLLVNGVTVGGAGDVSGPYLVNPSAAGNADSQPNDLAQLPLCAAGALVGSIAPKNVLAAGVTDLVVAAVFEGSDLIGGLGRVSVVMDTDWEFLAGCENPNADAFEAIANIASFLAP